MTQSALSAFEAPAIASCGATLSVTSYYFYYGTAWAVSD
jgi:hypothetical protein